MELSVADIEREQKYIRDCDEGSRQYKRGYVRALECIAEVINNREGVQPPNRNRYPAVERLLSSISLRSKEALSFDLSDSLSTGERETSRNGQGGYQERS